MGRHKVVENGRVVSVRLPQEFLENMPEGFNNQGDWIRSLLLGNTEIPITTSKPSISSDKREAIKFFYDLYNNLMDNEKILMELITKYPELEKYAKLFGELAN